MMRSIITIVFLVLASLSWATKTYSIQVRILSLPEKRVLPNCTVTLEVDGITKSIQSDLQGKALFINVSGKDITVSVADPSGNYHPSSRTTSNKKGYNLNFDIDLYPTDKKEAKLYQEEDEKYGPESEITDLFGSTETVDSLKLLCDTLNSRPAVFGNGFGDLMRYIQTELNYPQECIEANIQGKVFLSFVIEKDGTVSHVRVVKGAHPALDYEAKRIFRKMPKWSPGICNGEPVRYIYRLPLNYNLQ